MSALATPELWVALVTLTALEIVLGIDNIVFISVLTGKLPLGQQARARTLGLGLALIARILLLLSLAWIARLTAPVVTVWAREVSWRDLILIGGGLFLLAKSTHEIHHTLEDSAAPVSRSVRASFSWTLVQLVLLDLVFSLDSVITAIGMANDVSVMVAAIVIAMGIMLLASGAVGGFVQRHPTVKMLALSFLLLIGMSLVAEGAGQHIPKGYVYFAMGFAVLVEALNQRVRPHARGVVDG